DFEGEVNKVRLHLHRRCAGHLAEFDFMVAVRRGQEDQLRTARRRVTAADLKAKRIRVELDGALEVVDAHPRVEEFFHNRHTAIGCARGRHTATPPRGQRPEASWSSRALVRSENFPPFRRAALASNSASVVGRSSLPVKRKMLSVAG